MAVDALNAPAVDAGATTWFVAQLRPNCRALAERHLARQDFVTFCPTVRRTARRAGRFAERESPLFPGYLFVGAGPAQDWQAINGTRGVTRLVSGGREESPARIAPALIAALRDRHCDESGAEQVAPGDRVELLRGPFADFVATVETVAPHQRIWVMLDVLGKATRVCVGAGDLARL